MWFVDAVARLNYLNDVGIDTIETRAALGVAMEAGLLASGDWEGMYRIISGISGGEILSLVIGAGAAVTGKVINAERIPAVKGQGIAAYDPRALRSWRYLRNVFPRYGPYSRDYYKNEHRSPKPGRVAGSFLPSSGKVCLYRYPGTVQLCLCSPGVKDRFAFGNVTPPSS